MKFQYNNWYFYIQKLGHEIWFVPYFLQCRRCLTSVMISYVYFLKFLNYRYGWTALARAAVDGNLDMAEAILEHGADVNLVSSKGDTALKQAASGGHIEMVKYLVGKKNNINKGIQ